MRPLRLRIKGVMPHLASSSGGVKLTWKLYFKETLARKWGRKRMNDDQRSFTSEGTLFMKNQLGRSHKTMAPAC